MTRKEANEAVKKHGGVMQAARAVGVSRGWLRRRLAGAKECPSHANVHPHGAHAGPAEEGRKPGRKLTEFREMYDKDLIVPTRVKAALKKLGPSGWEYEVSFCKMAEVSLADLSAYRPAFDQHIVSIRRDGKRAWAGSPALAQKMREMLS